jgi:hypothetical protein
MNSKWRELDLGGGGLQSANLRLARTLRRRATAWRLLLLFPAGAHRWYLHEYTVAAAYPALTLTSAAGWLFALPYLLLPALLALVLLLAHDIATLENRITAINKRQRIAVYLSQGADAPAGFRGRFGTEEGNARAEDGPAPRRVPTLAEQEALLRGIAARKAPGTPKSQ